MKVYVDEMPKTCESCIYDDVIDCCELMGIDYFKLKDSSKHPNCPLQSLANHDKEVRKQVCDEIRDELSKELDYNIDSEVPIMVVCHKINKVLDQIEEGGVNYGK